MGPRSAPGRWFPLLTLAAAFAAVAWLGCVAVASFGGFYIWDDSLITYQYGRNLALGRGLRYNAADAVPTEGFSSLGHVLLAAAGIARGVDPLVLTWVASILCLAAAPLVVAVPLARHTGIHWASAGAVCAALQLFWFIPEATPQNLHVGMETLLFQFALFLVCAWILVEAAPPGGQRERPSVRVALSLVSTALVVLGRPEGPVVVALAVAWIVAVRRFSPRAERRPRRGDLLVLGVVPGAVVGALFLFRASYFGHLLPNAYFVKSGASVFGYAGPVLPGIGEVRKFIRVASPALAATALLLLGARQAPCRPRVTFACVLAPGLVMVGLYARAIHEAAGHFRFLYPYLAFVHVALSGAVCLAVARRPAAARLAPWALGVAALALGFLMGRPQRNRGDDPTFWLRTNLRDNPPHWIGATIARDLGRLGLGQRATVATSISGAAAWYSGMRTIDLFGLNTPELSGRVPLTPESFWGFVESRRPDVLVSGAPPATKGFALGSDDPALHSLTVETYLRTGAGSELTRLGDRGRMREMVQREMLFIRASYFLGGAYRERSGWIFAYVRRDSPFAYELYRGLRASAYHDATTDLAARFVSDPRTLTRWFVE